MGKRPARDPGAPKRNMGAYLVHQNAMREQFKALNPGVTFAQLAKDTLAMYSELPPSDKEAWVARAEADKALKTFMNLPRTYLPLVMTQKETRSLEVREAAKENTRRTQRLRSEICRLICSIRTLCVSSFKRENPGMTFGPLAKHTSHMYKNLTHEEKATWEARASQDKARYDAEIKACIPPPGQDARRSRSDD